MKRIVLGLALICLSANLHSLVINANEGSNSRKYREPFPAVKCTSLLVGKNATVDGSVICTQSADAGVGEACLYFHPPVNHKPDETRIVKCWNVYDRLGIFNNQPVRSGRSVEIPQIERTYCYVSSTFPFMNEHQVSVAEATIGNVRPELSPSENSDAKLEITDLSCVALERAKSAREAIQIMAALLEEHGFDAWLPTVGEYFAVADENEVWAFEFVPVGPDWKKKSGQPGVCWCAMRIPDDQFAVMANESIIGEIDLNDKDKFMASSNVMSLAVKHGWWDPKSGQPFRWDEAYCGKRAKSLRTWRALSLVAPSQKLKPDQQGYPNPIKPDKNLSLLDIRKIHGDHFEGTEFDLTKGEAAGPSGCPDRAAYDASGNSIPDYSIGQLSSNTVIINQCRDWLPDPIGGVMWVGMSGGDINCYVPFYAGVTRLPQAYTTGVRTKFDWDSAFWLFYFVGKWARLDYNNMIKEIQRVQYEVESSELEEQQGIDEEAYSHYLKSPDSAKEFLTCYCMENAEKVLKRWRELASYLIVKYGPVTAFVPSSEATDPWRK